jgi:hypothetical protein
MQNRDGSLKLFSETEIMTDMISHLSMRKKLACSNWFCAYYFKIKCLWNSHIQRRQLERTIKEEKETQK